MNKILILGASGFIGNTLYKELQPYFDVFGTYCHENDQLEQNQIFYKFDVERDDILDVLKENCEGACLRLASISFNNCSVVT